MAGKSRCKPKRDRRGPTGAKSETAQHKQAGAKRVPIAKDYLKRVGKFKLRDLITKP